MRLIAYVWKNKYSDGTTSKLHRCVFHNIVSQEIMLINSEQLKKC